MGKVTCAARVLAHKKWGTAMPAGDPCGGGGGEGKKKKAGKKKKRGGDDAPELPKRFRGGGNVDRPTRPKRSVSGRT